MNFRRYISGQSESTKLAKGQFDSTNYAKHFFVRKQKEKNVEKLRVTSILFNQVFLLFENTEMSLPIPSFSLGFGGNTRRARQDHKTRLQHG